MDLSPERVGQFDVVFFLGVLYHLRHPLLALERIASVTRKLLILETVVDMVGIGRPAMAFYPGRELNNDPTNWWAPNLPALHGMLRDVGFADVRTVTPEPSAIYRAARAVSHRLRGKNPGRGYRQDRAVVQATATRQSAVAIRSRESSPVGVDSQSSIQSSVALPAPSLSIRTVDSDCHSDCDFDCRLADCPIIHPTPFIPPPVHTSPQIDNR